MKKENDKLLFQDGLKVPSYDLEEVKRRFKQQTSNFVTDSSNSTSSIETEIDTDDVQH